MNLDRSRSVMNLDRSWSVMNLDMSKVTDEVIHSKCLTDLHKKI